MGKMWWTGFVDVLWQCHGFVLNNCCISWLGKHSWLFPLGTILLKFFKHTVNLKATSWKTYPVEVSFIFFVMVKNTKCFINTTLTYSSKTWCFSFLYYFFLSSTFLQYSVSCVRQGVQLQILLVVVCSVLINQNRQQAQSEKWRFYPVFHFCRDVSWYTMDQKMSFMASDWGI